MRAICKKFVEKVSNSKPQEVAIFAVIFAITFFGCGIIFGTVGYVIGAIAGCAIASILAKEGNLSSAFANMRASFHPHGATKKRKQKRKDH